MSTFQEVYLGMAIAGMTALFLALAWAVLYTRETPQKAKASETPAKPEPAPQRKLAA